jgi:hypothetical protein
LGSKNHSFALILPHRNTVSTCTPSPKRFGTNLLKNNKKRAGAMLRPVESILGEDRHDGLMVVHCNKDNCKMENFGTEKKSNRLRTGRSSLVPQCAAVL